MGGAPQVQAPKAPDTAQEYQQSLQAYMKNAPGLYAEESAYQPLYNQLQTQMNQQNIAQFGQQYFNMVPQATDVANVAQTSAQASQLANMKQFGPQTTQAMMASNPAFAQLQGRAQMNLAAGADPTMTGILNQVRGAIPGQQQGFSDLAAQTGRDVSGVNEQLQQLYGKAGAETSAADLAGIRNRVAADPRSQIFQQTAGQVMGNLGKVDPLTGQLKSLASEQLALGGNISAQEAQDVTQQARAAFSARGMLNANASIGAELLGRSQYQQQRLQQREQFAGDVSQLAAGQEQQRTANALGLTTTDIGATQANMQLAGGMTRDIAGINQANIGLQSGLQGAIADNLARARQQQQSLQQAGISAFQTGTQQAAGLQGSILDELYRQQAAGTSGLQYLAGAGQQNLAQILGYQGQGTQVAGAGGAQNIYGTGGPNLFQSSGVLSLMNQNQMAQMNAQGAAGMSNAQSKGAASGAMIGAGAGIAGSLIGAGAMLF